MRPALASTASRWKLSRQVIEGDEAYLLGKFRMSEFELSDEM